MIPWHVVSGMNGAIMILPRDGLKDGAGKPLSYDRAYYVGEQDFYIPRDAEGNFKAYDNAGDGYEDMLAVMKTLTPTHEVFNGAVGALTGENAMTAKVGETVLIIHSQANRDTRPHLIGGHGDHLGQSIWLREVQGREAGAPPPIDLAAERAHGDTVRALVQAGTVTAVHDISDCGLIVTVAEMALAGKIGATLDPLNTAQAFGEDQARYVVTTAADVTFDGAVRIGTTGGDSVAGVPLNTLRTAHEGFLPNLMNG